MGHPVIDEIGDGVVLHDPHQTGDVIEVGVGSHDQVEVVDPQSFQML